MKIENIPLARIDLTSAKWDEFIFTYPVEPGPVLESIRAVGLQQPIVVADNEENFHVVIGVRRLLSCQALEWEKIPAIVRRKASREELLWLSLQEKVGGRPLNAMEKSRVLQRFAALWEGDLERVEKEICPLLGLPATLEAVENHLFLKDIPESHQKDLAEGRLTPQHTELLRPLRPEDRRVAAEKLFGAHRVSLQEAREILENAAGLAARRGTRVADIFEQPELKEIFVRESYTPRQRTALLRTWLHEERFPKLSALAREFEALSEKIAAGTSVSVRPPRDFEGEEITVSFRARQPDEIHEILATMQTSERRGLWKKLFALLQGEAHAEETKDDF